MSRLNADVKKQYPRLLARSSPQSASSTALPSEMMRKQRSYPKLTLKGFGGNGNGSSSSSSEDDRVGGPRRAKRTLKVNVTRSLDYPMGLSWNDGTPVHASSLLRYPSTASMTNSGQTMGGEGLPEAKSPKV